MIDDHSIPKGWKTSNSTSERASDSHKEIPDYDSDCRWDDESHPEAQGEKTFHLTPQMIIGIKKAELHGRLQRVLIK
ncbi:MAG: hypothetical protein LUH14_08640 [Clostridiaceae bacterium]|nr:hypothetical protein [Clostridiaceae bacterium]